MEDIKQDGAAPALLGDEDEDQDGVDVYMLEIEKQDGMAYKELRRILVNVEERDVVRWLYYTGLYNYLEAWLLDETVDNHAIASCVWEHVVFWSTAPPRIVQALANVCPEKVQVVEAGTAAEGHPTHGSYAIHKMLLRSEFINSSAFRERHDAVQRIIIQSVPQTVGLRGPLLPLHIVCGPAGKPVGDEVFDLLLSAFPGAATLPCVILSASQKILSLEDSEDSLLLGSARGQKELPLHVASRTGQISKHQYKSLLEAFP
jgi:hypothetical protein